MVGRGDERHELVVDELFPLRVVQRLLDARVHDAHARRGVLHVVIHELGVVLRADASQVAALGLGDAQAVEGVLHVVGQGVPVAFLVGVGLDVGHDVVHVQPGDGGAPIRGSALVVDLERLQAVLEHPRGFVLFRGNLAHDFGSKAGVELLGRLLAV